MHHLPPQCLRLSQHTDILNMATRTVRFQFVCDNVPEGLDFDHLMPESLIISLSKAREEFSFADRFHRAILPVMKEHEAACRAASNPFCRSCESYHNRTADTNVLPSQRGRSPCRGHRRWRVWEGRMRKANTASHSRGDARGWGRARGGGSRDMLRGMWNEGTDQKVRKVQGGRILRERSPKGGLEETQESVRASRRRSGKG
jgi:hypothetical protein